MNRFRGRVMIAVIGLACVLVPAAESEAGLIDWLRCVVNPCRWPCRLCPSPCEPNTCPVPVVTESAYCAPCPPCPVTYVRRSYLEACTRMTTQYALEACPTYVRRRYWDPCAVCYRTYYEPATSYVRRKYCVPVTEYVERSYLEPVTNCVGPTCPTSTAPEITESSTTTSAGSSRSAPIIGGPVISVPRASGRPAAPSNGSPARSNMRLPAPTTHRPEPLALGVGASLRY